MEDDKHFRFRVLNDALRESHPKNKTDTRSARL